MEAESTVRTVEIFVVLLGLATLIGIVLRRWGHPAIPYSLALVASGLVIGAFLPHLNPIVTP